MIKNKIYFASDFHLGVPNFEASRVRELRVIKWLDEIKGDASEIYLVGDIFDFWFEYKTVVPKGYVRLLGKLAELSHSGIKLHYFIGNHDMWMFNYMTEELNIPIHRAPITFERNGKSFYIGHGDGLGPGDYGYKTIKKIFANPICQWLFKWIHPDIGMSVANYWSGKSRHATGISDDTYLGDDKEWLMSYCREQLEKKHYDYFIFGHRHLPINKPVGEKSTYINLGDWIKYNTYAVFDGDKLDLKEY